jgi:hypothetical protein
LKLVVLKTKFLAEPGREFQNELLIARALRTARLVRNYVARFTQKPNGFWHISFSCQRAGLPVRQELRCNHRIVAGPF